jgi:hypothetical protein
LSAKQKSRLVQAILGRFKEGFYSEQFKDQLRLAIQLAPADTFAAGREKLSSTRQYVRRYAAWLLSHEAQHRIL